MITEITKHPLWQRDVKTLTNEEIAELAALIWPELAAEAERQQNIVSAKEVRENDRGEKDNNNFYRRQ